MSETFKNFVSLVQERGYSRCMEVLCIRMRLQSKWGQNIIFVKGTGINILYDTVNKIFIAGEDNVSYFWKIFGDAGHILKMVKFLEKKRQRNQLKYLKYVSFRRNIYSFDLSFVSFVT